MSLKNRLREVAKVYSDTEIRLEVVELLPGESTESARDRVKLPVIAANGLRIMIIGLSNEQP